MKKQENKIKKVNSFTEDGEKAITRSCVYKGDGFFGIQFVVLYFSKKRNEKDELVRVWGDRLVYRRTWDMKLNTLIGLLQKLNIITFSVTPDRQ